MRNFRIIVLFLLAALSYAWAQSFNIYKDGLNLGTGTVNANFTYRDSDVFSVGPGIVENEDWCWALTVAPTACLNGTAEYTPIILENPTSDYTWNIVITRKSDGATRNLNLTIKERPSHAVTFTTNGGLPVPSAQTVLDGDKATEPSVSPTKTGYDFNGWDFDFDTEIKAPVAIPAKWEAIEYDITFDAQGGTVSPTTQQVTYDSPVGTLATTSRDGYTFGGWFTQVNGGGTEYTATTTYQTAGNITLYAKWTSIEYTITFDAQGGTSPSPADMEVDYGSQVGTLATTSRDGYTFGGWFTQANGSGTKYETTTIYETAGNITLYAKWTPIEYTITFDAQGGTTPSPTSILVNYGSQVGTLPTTSRDGYTFGGWFTQINGGGTKYETTTTYQTADDIALYAKWTANTYTITFNAQGGDALSPTSKQVVYDSQVGTLATTSRDGYTFGGWFTEINGGGTEYTATTTYQTANNITLYAKWTAIEYTITFDEQGGTTPSPTSKQVNYGSQVGSLATTSRDGYTFGGWFTEINGGGTEYIAATIYQTANNITLYAKWTIKTYTVSFNVAGGTPSTIEPQTINHGQSATAPAQPAKTGYTFGGWEYPAGTPYTFTESVTSNITLTAVWNPKTYTIDFDANCPSPLFDSCPSNPTQKTGVQYGVEIGTLDELTLTGYNFQGWFYNDKKYEATTPPYDIDGDITLSAKWEIKKFTVTWTVDGIEARKDNNVEYGTIGLTLPSTIPPGYENISWDYTSSIPITDNTTITATYNLISYTITYNADGGTTNPSSPNNYNIKSGTVTLLPATKTCIEFAGWYDNSTFTGSPITTFVPNTTNLGNKTFYAKWADKMTPTASDLNYSIPTLTYNGTEQPITTSLKPNACGLEPPNILYNGTNEKPKNAGTYKVSASFAESPNYKAATIELGELTIAKANVSFSISATIADKYYDATTTAEITDISFAPTPPFYANDQLSASDYSVSANFENANVGEKTVSVKVTWATNSPLHKNYNLTPQNFNETASILQATGILEIKAPELYELTNLSNQTIAIVNKNPFIQDNQIIWEYRKEDSSEYSDRKPNRVGEWIVRAMFPDDPNGNYTGAIDSAFFTVTRGSGTRVIHKIEPQKGFENEPNFSDEQKKYFAVEAEPEYCEIKSTKIQIDVIEADITLKVNGYPPSRDCSKDDYCQVECKASDNCEMRFYIPIDFGELKPGLDTLIYSLESKDEIYIEYNTILIERPVNFDSVKVQKWNNTILINNNSITNGGYNFTDYQWFRNNEALKGETLQFYSAGPSINDTLKTSDRYKVQMFYEKDGETFRISTCENNTGKDTAAKAARINAYRKQILGIGGSTPNTSIYNTKGERSSGKTPGVYIVDMNK